MKSIRFRLLVAALAVMLGGAIAKSQTADAAAPTPASGHASVSYTHLDVYKRQGKNGAGSRRGRTPRLLCTQHKRSNKRTGSLPLYCCGGAAGAAFCMCCCICAWRFASISFILACWSGVSNWNTSL